MNRAGRKIKAEETVKIFEDGFYYDKNNCRVELKTDIDNSVKNTVHYTSEDLDELNDNVVLDKNFDTIFEVTNEDSISAILRLSKNEEVMCLNFASAKNPGGGFLNGSLAQEESLALSSGLHESQMSVFEFYEMHRNMKSCLYTDHMIYSPNVPVFRDHTTELLSEYQQCSFITSPAVNLGAVKRNEPNNVDSVQKVMSKRIEKLLSLSYAKKDDTLILGAWGCGVFQNDPNDIAKLFKSHFDNKFKNQFKRVVFAIYSKNEKFIEAFQKEFD